MFFFYTRRFHIDHAEYERPKGQNFFFQIIAVFWVLIISMTSFHEGLAQNLDVVNQFNRIHDIGGNPESIFPNSGLFVDESEEGLDSQNLKKVILVYNLLTCKVSHTGVKGVKNLLRSRGERNLGDDLEGERNLIFSMFEKKIRQLYYDKHRGRILHMSNTKREIDSQHIFKASNKKDKISNVIHSRYFRVLHMEVAQIPNSLSDEEVMNITKSLPCLEYSVMDYKKQIDPPQPSVYNDSLTQKKESIQSQQDTVKKDDVMFTTKTSTLPNQPITGQFTTMGNTSYTTDQKTITITDRQLSPPSGSTLGRFITNLFTGRKKPTSSTVPNDPYYVNQWYLQDRNEYGIDAQKGWSMVRENATPETIAIIDTGCDIHHPDLVGNLWKNPGEICGDGIDNDNNGYIDDCYGWDWTDNDNDTTSKNSYHGTAVAGIVSGASNNHLGITSVCWNCKFMCLKFINGSTGLISNEIAAFDYAASMGVRISTNSYGGYGTSIIEYEIIKRLRSQGHFLICSAGNNNKDLETSHISHTPSSYRLENIISVGSSTIRGTKDKISNYGKTKVDVFSPGSYIYGAITGGNYKYLHGTSFATPVVAGIVAVLWSQYPTLTYHQIYSLILKGCKPSPTLQDMCVCNGVVNLARTLEWAAELVTHGTSEFPHYHKFSDFMEHPSNNLPTHSKFTKVTSSPESGDEPDHTDFLKIVPPFIRTFFSNQKIQEKRHNTTSFLLEIEKTAHSFLRNITSPSSLVRTLVQWIPITPLTAFLLFVQNTLQSARRVDQRKNEQQALKHQEKLVHVLPRRK